MSDRPLNPEESALVDRYVTAVSEIRETWGPKDAAAAWTAGEQQIRGAHTLEEFRYVVVRMETAGREAAARRARRYQDAAQQAATVGRHRAPGQPRTEAVDFQPLHRKPQELYIPRNYSR